MSTAIVTTNDTLSRIITEIDHDPHLKSPNTRRGYAHDLAMFEAWRNGRPMTKLLIEEYAALLQQQGKSPNTINRILSSVRWWARRIIDMAHDAPMPVEQREEVIRIVSRIGLVEDVTGSRASKGRMIEDWEINALLKVCRRDASPAGIRDSAIFGVAIATGMRRSEIASLQLSDLHWSGDEEAEISVIGKGDKSRKAYLYNGAALAMRDWLSVRGNEDGSLFYAIDKAGHIINAERVYGVKGVKGSKKSVEPGMSDEGLAQMLAKRAAQAELDEHLSWHDFRRTFASELLEHNDIATVQKLMGHSSPVTTSNYDRRDERARQRAVKGIRIPYKPREEK